MKRIGKGRLNFSPKVGRNLRPISLPNLEDRRNHCMFIYPPPFATPFRHINNNVTGKLPVTWAYT